MRFREHRFPCDQPVTVMLDAARVPAFIVNISVHGARLAGIDGLHPGQRVTIDPGPGCPLRSAEVRWTRAQQAGVRFAVPVDARTIAVVRKTATTARGPGARWNLGLQELR